VSDGDRSWTHHLRLLPGGDADTSSAVLSTLALYFVLGILGLITGGLVHDGFPSELQVVAVIGMGNALPLAVIGGWTAVRIRGSKAIASDQAAADLDNRRVFYGDEVARVPRRARVFSIRPRQLTAELADGRSLRLFYRVNADPDDLVALARALRDDPDLSVEDYVARYVRETAADMLPDPEGVREAVAHDLLKKGVVITRAESS